jgi:hypothetical protein
LGGLGGNLLADDRANERTESVGMRLQPAGADTIDDRPQMRVDPAQMPHRGSPAIQRANRRHNFMSTGRGTEAICVHFSCEGNSVIVIKCKLTA